MRRSQIRDFSGDRRGTLEVLRYVGIRTGGSRKRWHIWLCRCDCGVELEVPSTKLAGATEPNCGCRKVEIATKIIEAYNASGLPSPTIKHGLTGSPEYISWAAMKARCLNAKNREYHRYGGRGIQVCERWLHSFDNFLADMGQKPTTKHSLDRINVDGNYEPRNCRWATPKEQARNTRSNRILEICGSKKTLAEWVEISGLRAFTILYRIEAGWPTERILTTPAWGRKQWQKARHLATSS